VIQKDGLTFVSLYFKSRTSDKYDVNYIWLYLQWRLLMLTVNVETMKKRTLHDSRQLSFNELTNAKKSCAAK